MITNPRKQFPLILCLAALLILSYFRYSRSAPKTFPETLYGQPVVSANYENVDSSIEQVLQDDKYIYAMLHHSNGVVQVYDLEGKYQFTLFFYCHTKGGFSMALVENTLYVQDMRQNVYVFQGGTFQQFVKAEDAKTTFPGLDFRTREISAGYEIQAGCVWRVSGNERVCIIGSPKQPAVSFVYLTVAFCVIVTVLFLGSHIGRRTARNP